MSGVMTVAFAGLHEMLKTVIGGAFCNADRQKIAFLVVKYVYLYC